MTLSVHINTPITHTTTHLHCIIWTLGDPNGADIYVLYQQLSTYLFPHSHCTNNTFKQWYFFQVCLVLVSEKNDELHSSNERNFQGQHATQPFFRSYLGEKQHGLVSLSKEHGSFLCRLILSVCVYSYATYGYICVYIHMCSNQTSLYFKLTFPIFCWAQRLCRDIIQIIIYAAPLFWNIRKNHGTKYNSFPFCFTYNSLTRKSRTPAVSLYKLGN